MLKPLEALIDAVRLHDSAAQFIFVGDYINRGKEAPGVINRLLALENATFLRGNHDDVFDLILSYQSYIGHSGQYEAFSAFTAFMNHGLADTLLAYGVDYAILESLIQVPDPEKLKEALKVVPDSHRQFFRALRPVAEFDTFFAAHAFWSPDEADRDPDISQRLEAEPRLRFQILWGRFSEAQVYAKKRWTKTGYFGHTPVVNYRKSANLLPVQGPSVVLLDTAAALGPSGRLSAVCPDNGEVFQADRTGVLLPPSIIT